MHIATYVKSTVYRLHPKRTRKLLLHRNEINKLFGRLTKGNLALIPVELYFNQRGLAKVRIGLAKKLKGSDKREHIKKRDMEKELRRMEY